MRSSRRTGFTLIELLVVVGIIGLLAALLIPMIFKASRQARKTRAKSDLQVISQLLNAYAGDFGNYPVIDYATTGFGNGTGQSSAARSTGAAVLGRALLGPGNAAYSTVNSSTNAANYAAATEYKPGDVVSTGGEATYFSVTGSTGVTPSADPKRWIPFSVYDGMDGPGFKARHLAGPDGAFNTADDQYPGKTWGPYVDPEKIHHRGLCLTDPDGGVIVYFPARKPRPNVTTDSGDEATQPYISAPPATPTLKPCASAYNANDGLEFFRRLAPTAESDPVALRRLRMAFGDYDANGFVGAGDDATSLPFVLIAPGIDGLYGPRDLEIPIGTIGADEAKRIKAAFTNSDDVTNLDAGQ